MNVKGQGKDQFVRKLYEHVQMFIQKFEFIQKQLMMKNVVHFTMLSTRHAATMDHEIYSAPISSVRDNFQERFTDFREQCDELKLFADPFGTDATDVHDMFQLELIEIQNDSDLKRAFSVHDLLTFYSQYVLSECYLNLSKHALQFVALFGSTYCCK